MGYLLPALTPERFETQRKVVLNERRQSYENRPYGLALMALMAGLFPFEHPVPLADHRRRARPRGHAVRRRARVLPHLLRARPTPRWCWPATWTPRTASSWRSAISATCPRAQRPAPMRAAASLAGSAGSCSRIAWSCRGCTWPGIRRRCSPPTTPSWISSADLVANGKAARLYRTLVYEDRVALDVSASQQSRELSSVFVLAATAAPGKSLADVAARVDVALTELAANGPTDAEMERSRAQVESQLPLPAADRRRLRRQVRSAERLQRAAGRPRLLRAGPRALRVGDAASRCGSPPGDT